MGDLYYISPGVTYFTGSRWGDATYYELPLEIEPRGQGGDVVRKAPSSLQRRSRGKHDPGDGPYLNRRVFSNEIRVRNIGRSGTLPFSLHGYAGGEWKDQYYGYVQSKWDGQDLFVAVVYTERNSLGPNGYQLQWNHYYFPMDDIVVYGAPYNYAYTYHVYTDSGSHYFRVGLNPSSALISYYPTIEACVSACQSWINMVSSTKPDRETRSTYRMYKLPTASEDASLPRFSEFPTMGIPLMSLKGNAYIDAINNLPSLSSMNNIANGLDLLKLVKSAACAIIKKDPMEVGNLAEAWLSYRYAFSTTRADVNELADYVSRSIDLLNVGHIKQHGTYHYVLGDDDNTLARCVVKMSRTELDSLLTPLERYGLQLDAYNAWDLLPFSFMVDWFTGIGDLLEWGRQKTVAFKSNPDEVWTSIERTFINEFGFQEIYYLREGGLPDLTQTRHVEGQVKSGKKVTIVKRAIDALAIFT